MWDLLSQEFVRLGHEVTVYSRKWDKQASREIANGVQFYRFGGFSASRFRTFNLLRDFWYAMCARHRIGSHDVLIINDALLPFLSKRSSGIRFVNINRFPRGQYRWNWNRVLLAAASSAIATEVRKQGVQSRCRVEVLPNCFSVKDFSPSDEVSSNRSGVLFAGRIHPEKGLDMLVEAAARMPETAFTIVGPHATSSGGGGEAYYQALKSRARNLNIRFLPPLFRTADLAALYQSHQAFVYPSLPSAGECLPVAPLEAMAAGSTVVCSDLPCFSDYLTDRETGYRFSPDAGPDALVSALRRALVTDVELRRRAQTMAQSYAPGPVATRWLEAMEGI